MRNAKLEFVVGLFALLGISALIYLSVQLGKMELVGDHYMQIKANFSSVSGLKHGASIEIAGVQVGRVDKILLDYEEYEAQVIMKIDKQVEIQEDAIASVRTKGIIGDRFIKLSPGASEIILKSGDTLIQTESAIIIEELISQFIHGSVEE